MNEKQIKAMHLSAKIKKQIFERLDDNNFYKALDKLLDRYNAVQLVAFPGMAPMTPGNMLDYWYETRVFESKL